MKKFRIKAVLILVATLLAGGAALVTAYQPALKPQLRPVPETSLIMSIYGSTWPGTPEASKELRWAAEAGFDIVQNYSAIDGTRQDIKAYLDEADELGVQVSISLKDLYDEMPQKASTKAFRQQFGDTPEAQAIEIVREFQYHPAVWGFDITDERPEGPAQLAKWQPILEKRYAKLKEHTDKPIKATLIGWSDNNHNKRQAMERSVLKAADELALDYYPLPENKIYGPVSRIPAIAHDLKAVAGDNGWFVVQAFAWGKGHPEGRPLGFSTRATAPTTEQMVQMSRLALDGGAKHLTFYSYLDNADDPKQLAAIAEAVKQLRALYD